MTVALNLHEVCVKPNDHVLQQDLKRFKEHLGLQWNQEHLTISGSHDQCHKFDNQEIVQNLKNIFFPFTSQHLFIYLFI